MPNITCLWGYSCGFGGPLLNSLFHFLLSCGESEHCSWSFVPGYGMVNRLVMWCSFMQLLFAWEPVQGQIYPLWYIRYPGNCSYNQYALVRSSRSGFVERMFLFLQTCRHGLHVDALIMERPFSLALFSPLVVVCFSGDKTADLQIIRTHPHQQHWILSVCWSFLCSTS